MSFARRVLSLLACFFLLAGSVSLAATTWKTQVSAEGGTDYRLNAVYFTSQATGCAVGNEGTILRSADRGKSWTTPASGNNHTIDAVHFPASSYGYAVGSDDTDSTGALYKTTDGGSSWSFSAVDPADYPLYDVFFTSTSEGYVSTTFNPGPGKHGVYKTTDGGATWNTSGTGLSNATYYGIHFVNSTTGWVCHDAGGIFKTTNGGANWSALTTGSSAHLRDIYFHDADNGWAVGNNELLRTTNGGTSWSKTTLPNPDQHSLQAVRFISATTGWAVGTYQGTKGIILSTTDGGASWAQDTTSAAMPLYGVSAIDQYNVWAVGGSSRYIAKLVVDPIVTIDLGGRNDRPTTWTGTATIEVPNLQAGATISATASFTETSRNATSITGTITLGAVGAQSVTVYNPDTGIGVGTFTVNPLPNIVSVTPSTLTQGTTADIVIEGSGFQAGLTAGSLAFSLAGITVNSLSRVNEWRVEANITVGAGAATGAGTLTLTNPDSGSDSDVFNVNSSSVTGPTITSLSPDSGTQGATSLNVTITGSNFHAGPPTVSFGAGITVNSVVFNSAAGLTANIDIAGGAPTGYRTVTVTNIDDGGIGSKSNAFRVVDPGAVDPTVASIIDNYIYPGTAKTLYLTGTGFQSGLLVAVNPADRILVQDIQYLGPTNFRLTVSAEAGALLGARDVIITNPDGGQVAVTGGLAVRPLAAPAGITIYPYPNPWDYHKTPNVTLQLEWPDAPADVRLVWTDNQGQVVKVPQTVRLNTGRNNLPFHSFTQQGAGHRLSAGLYIVNLIYNNKIAGKAKVMVVPW